MIHLITVTDEFTDFPPCRFERFLPPPTWDKDQILRNNLIVMMTMTIVAKSVNKTKIFSTGLHCTAAMSAFDIQVISNCFIFSSWLSLAS